MRIGSLFSGIGGLELGLEWSGLGETVWQVEIDPFCRSVLERHWPNARRFEDVTKVGAEDLEKVDLICGGFPCQDVSSAGKGEGLAGSRSGLWFEFARIVGELRPRWVVVENVASGAKRWVDQVVAGLEQLDYQALPIPLSAQDVGAPYPRARIFVVAYTDRSSESTQPEHAEMVRAQESDRVAANARIATSSARDVVREQPWRCRWQDRKRAEEPERDSWWATVPEVHAVVPGIPGRVDHQRALGNAVVPQCAEVIGWIIRELQ